LGKQIRTAFVADKGMTFISADYSQFELRIAAALSGEQTMIEAFNRDVDIHTLTAAQIHNKSADEVTKQERYSAKAVNFGIMYGQGPHGLSEGTGMSMAEAKDFIERYFTIRPALKKYIEDLRLQAKEQGFVETILGRRRPTPDAKSANFAVRQAAERAAINMPIQGSAADLTKMAMIEVDKLLPDGAKQILQIHDSIMVEAPKEAAEAVAQSMKQVMEQIYPALGIKLLVDVSIGEDWGQL
jgi:DNA polymerase-1